MKFTTATVLRVVVCVCVCVCFSALPRFAPFCFDFFLAFFTPTHVMKFGTCLTTVCVSVRVPGRSSSTLIEQVAAVATVVCYR